MHFQKYLTGEKLKDLISENNNFQSIFSLLSENEKTTLMKNLLSYGTSIDDKECFYGQVIN